MSTGCSICDDKILVRAVDEELERGLSYAGTSKLMTARGFPFSANVISNHDKHRVKLGNHPDAKVSKRDLAVLVRDRVYDRIETLDDEVVDIKDFSTLASAGLKAQGLIDKRETKKVTQNFWVQLYTETQGEVRLLEDPNTLEGVAVDVSPE